MSRIIAVLYYIVSCEQEKTHRDFDSVRPLVWWGDLSVTSSTNEDERETVRRWLTPVGTA
ncbi:hypothetical protein HSB1_39890 [Halogranum salarium B-1]|uniref:Uncharacterized protein n=1 Tax=Halogranum salarium B-1 TaxID=1210908 RepID=J2ZX65_9EURY|nr:hypothetical protein HSB1_39890 [Halogranum salarium B-1]